MKMEKTKHNHSLTDCLKVGIYAIIMLAPVTAILSTTSYMAFNRNAELPTQETTRIVEHKPQTNEVNSEEDLIDGNWYNLVFNPNNDIDILCYECMIIEDYEKGTIDYYKRYDYAMALYTGDDDVYFFDIGWTEIAVSTEHTILVKHYENNSDIGFTALTEEELSLIPSTYETQQVVVQENANAFYYACNQVIEQPLFNWTQDTGTFQVFNSVTNGLGMQDQTLPTILTYMFLVTIIYLIIDIIIEVIKLITHMITSDK